MSGDKVTLFDLIGASNGTIGAMVGGGKPSPELALWGGPVIHVSVGGHACTFLTRQKPVDKAWCADFAERYFARGDDVEIVDFSLFRVKMPNARAGR